MAERDAPTNMLPAPKATTCQDNQLRMTIATGAPTR